MSELAFNANGESFEVPATVTGWRVRRMKPRGAPELVYSKDGVPLTIGIEADIEELRDAVGTPGKYRLDPINDDNKCVENVPAAYIQVVKPERVVPSGTTAAPAANDDAIREAMRLNTELAKSVIDRFPEMMHAAAELLRAADGAGLPARTPRDTDEDDDTEDDEPEQAASSGFDLSALVAQVVPLIVMSLGKGKLKMPDLASVLDWRKASPQKQIADEEENAPTVKASTVEDEPINLPPLDPATMAHFIAVQSALKPKEAALAREVAGDLSPAELRAWFDELSKLSVPDAVTKIRTLIGNGAAS